MNYMGSAADREGWVPAEDFKATYVMDRRSLGDVLHSGLGCASIYNYAPLFINCKVLICNEV